VANLINKLSNDEQVDLSVLSIDELRKLHFEEECIFCEKILKLPPFSFERKELLTKGYDFAITVKEEIGRKQGESLTSHGASKKSIKVLKKLLIDKLLKSKEPVVLYEAGVGNGYAISEVLSCFNSDVESNKLKIKGCDIYMQPKMQSLISSNSKLEISEGDIYNLIKILPDNCIDVFYADNVIEHFIPDEAEIIFSEIARILKPEGYLYMWIPNRYVGPRDVSGYFLPFGSKALGTHFMEMSFNDITTAMNKNSIFHSHCVFFMPKTNLIFSIKNEALIKLKLSLESIFAKIPTRFLRRLNFALFGFSVSVMKKKETYEV